MWGSIEQHLGDTLITPREVVWLNGAPGSGKGGEESLRSLY